MDPDWSVVNPEWSLSKVRQRLTSTKPNDPDAEQTRQEHLVALDRLWKRLQCRADFKLSTSEQQTSTTQYFVYGFRAICDCTDAQTVATPGKVWMCSACKVEIGHEDDVRVMMAFLASQELASGEAQERTKAGALPIGYASRIDDTYWRKLEKDAEIARAFRQLSAVKS